MLTEKKKKKDIWPKSRKFFNLVGMFRTLSPEVSILVTQKTAPRRQEGKSGSMLLCNRRRRQSEHQRSVFSILCMGRCKPLGSLNLFLSYAPQLSGANHVSLFTFWSGRWLSLAFPQLLRSQSLGGSGRFHLVTVWGSLIHIWRPEIADGGDVSYLLVTAGDIFISRWSLSFKHLCCSFFIFCCSFFGVWG